MIENNLRILELDDFTVAVNHDTAAILKYKGNAREVTVPSHIDGTPVTVIDTGAFAGNKELTSVTLPDTLRLIGVKAFYNCQSLCQVNIPDGVTHIGDDAFGFATLTTVILPDSVISVGKEAFARSSSLKTVVIGKGLVALGAKIFYFDNELETILVDGGNPNFCVKDGVLFNSDQSVLLQYPNRRPGVAYAIPETVTTIAQAAFAWNTGLKAVTIPDSIEIIGVDAFELSRLEEVTFSKHLRVIGDGAFAQCFRLHNVEFPNSLKMIGKAAFCHNLSMTKIYIPDSVVHIGNCAFQLCTGVTEVFIGRNIAHIGYKAFSGTTFNPNESHHMGLRSFTVLNRTVPIDVFTFDFNPHLILYGYADNVTLKARAGSTMTFKAIPCNTVGVCQGHVSA